MELEEISAAVAAPEVPEAEVQETPEAAEIPETPAQPEEVAELVEKVEEPEADPSDIIKALPPRKKTAQERIAEMTYKQREAERQAAYWKEKAEKQEPGKPAVKTSGRPKLEEFDTTEAYEDALLSWHTERTTTTLTERREQERKEQAVKQFNIKAEKVREVFEDFDEVVQSPVFTPTMQSVLLTSESGPQMAYYLGRPENVKIAQKIASMPSELQPYEIGKLETRLLLAAKTKTVTKAPAPITPVNATNASPTVDESKLSDDEWYKREKARRYEALKKKHGG